MRKTTAVLAGLALLGASACAEMEVTNLDEPDVDRALEALPGSSFRSLWRSMQDYEGAAPSMSVIADEWTSSWGNAAMNDLGGEPRKALDNTPTYTYSSNFEFTWENAYRAISSASTALAAINDGVRLVDGGTDRTEAAAAFAKFVQGFAHVWVGAVFDQGYIFDETMDPEELIDLSPADEVHAAGIGYLEEAVQLAQAGDFQLPGTWINGQPLTSDELAAMAHAVIARFTAAHARTPAEREAVDWGSVISHVDAAFELGFVDLAPTGSNVWWDDLKWMCCDATWGRMDLRWLGRADVSGEYEAWMATPVANRDRFTIETPDRRISNKDIGEVDSGEVEPDEGAYVYVDTYQPFNPSRGSYHFSDYIYRRHQVEHWLADGSFTGPMRALTAVELNLLKAEALIRLDREGEAVPLINATRVENGGLPAVTVDGPPNDPASCVPQNPDGSCGDLMEALKWEKHIELYATGGGIMWFDRRGWGDLVPGSPIQYPVPGSELQNLSLPNYTFGGGQDGAATCDPSISTMCSY